MRATTPPLLLRRNDGGLLAGSRAASAQHQQQMLQQLHVDSGSNGLAAPSTSFLPQTRHVTPQLVVDGFSATANSSANPPGQRSAIIGPSRNYSMPQGSAAAYNQVPQQQVQQQFMPSTVALQMPQQQNSVYSAPKQQQEPYYGYEQEQQQQRLGRPPHEFISSTINQWNGKMQQEALAMAQLDQEEALLAAEESALRGKIAELEERRVQLDKEQFAVNQGWSTLYEMEERYYTEPVVDRTQEISEAEYRCAILQERFNEAQLQLDMVSRQLESFAYVEGRKREQAAALERLASGFDQLERRRNAAVARAEHLFDIEAQRERKASSFVQTLDSEIRTITVTAGLTAPSSSSNNHSGVDSNRQSLQPQRSRVVSFDQTPETILVTRDAPLPGLDCDSVCYGLDDDGLGETSVAYSVCNLKKPRMEPALVR